MKHEYKYVSPVGLLTLESDGEALTSLAFPRARCTEKEIGGAESAAGVLLDAKRWLDIYFSGREPDFTPPLKMTGSEFRLTVWKLLLELPYGATATYGEIAAKAAERLDKDKMSAQAVGGAVGANPIGIIVPCHRVIGADGSMTGFGGGTDVKRALLGIEGIKTR